MADSHYQSPPPPPPPGGYQGGGYGGYQGGPPPPRPTNVLSILALVAGVIAFFTGLVPVLGLLLGLVAVALGVVGLRKARTLMGSGKGLSIAGIVLGAVAAVTSLISAIVVGGVLNAASDAASSAASSAVAPGPAPSSPEQSSAAPAPGQSSAAQPPAQGQFPGQTADDQVAPAGSPITIDGLTITTTPLAAQTTVLGNYWCTSVTYQNGGSGQAPYNLFDWKVLNPSGASESATLTGQDGALSSGELAPGGTVTGNVCFNDSSVQPGQDVVLYEVTSLFSNDRGAWLNTVS